MDHGESFQPQIPSPEENKPVQTHSPEKVDGIGGQKKSPDSPSLFSRTFVKRSAVKDRQPC
jgi:hypothetical protein